MRFGGLPQDTEIQGKAVLRAFHSQRSVQGDGGDGASDLLLRPCLRLSRRIERAEAMSVPCPDFASTTLPSRRAVARLAADEPGAAPGVQSKVGSHSQCASQIRAQTAKTPTLMVPGGLGRVPDQHTRETSASRRTGLGLEQRTSPFATASKVDLAVVQAMLAMGPEFDHVRTYAKPRPP